MISEKWLKEKLKENYKKHIFFTDLPRRSDVVCFKDMAAFFLYKMKKDSQTKEDVIITAAKIINMFTFSSQKFNGSNEM